MAKSVIVPKRKSAEPFETKISPFLSEISETIETNLVSMVVAETGSGKSVSVPPHLIERARMAVLPQPRVMVVVPTVQAALNLAKIQRENFAHPSIGHAADSIVRYDSETRLIYATYGHLRCFLTRVMERETKKTGALPRDFNPFESLDVLIIDEIHMMGSDVSFILGLWDFFFSRFRAEIETNQLNFTRLVMMSATPHLVQLPSIPEYAQWPPEIMSKPRVPEYIQVCYHSNNECIIDVRSIGDEVFGVFRSLNKKCSIEDYGDFLIFMPGEKEIRLLAEKITGMRKENLIVLISHSSLPQEEMDLLFVPTPEGSRKVIISTNIAESSLTFGGVGVVISVPLHKEAHELPSGGVTLATVRTTQSNEIQRAGRAGRIPRNGAQRGICYRMLCESTYLGDTREQSIPEIQRIPIHNIVLELLSSGLDPNEVRLEGVPPERIEKSIELLISLDLLEGEQMRTVNARGSFVQRTTLGLRNATVLYNCLTNLPRCGSKRTIGTSLLRRLHNWNSDDLDALAYGIIVLVCLIDSFDHGYFWIPNEKNVPGKFMDLDDYLEYYFEKYHSHTDLVSLLLLHDSFRAYTRCADNKADLMRLAKQWATHNSIRLPVWKNFLKVLDRTIGHIEKSFRVDVVPSKIDIAGTVRFAYRHIATAYASNIMFENDNPAIKFTHIGPVIGNACFNRLRQFLPTTKDVYSIQSHSSKAFRVRIPRVFLDIVMPVELPEQLLDNEIVPFLPAPARENSSAIPPSRSAPPREEQRYRNSRFRASSSKPQRNAAQNLPHLERMFAELQCGQTY